MFPTISFRGIRKSIDSDDDEENNSKQFNVIENSKNNDSNNPIQTLYPLNFLPQKDLVSGTQINEDESSSFISTINQLLYSNKDIDNSDQKKIYYDDNVQTNSLEYLKQEEISIYQQIQNNNSFVIVENQREKISLSLIVINKLFDLYNKNLYSKLPKIIFLVCDVTVIENLTNEIKLYSKLRISSLKGKNSKKSQHTYKEFQSIFTTSDIFVANPDVFYKLLTIGYIKITDISLIIFDDCHNCTANHTYNLIMTDFYFYYLLELNLQKSQLPHILGFTTVKKNEPKMSGVTLQKLIELSENLDSQVIIDPNIINSSNENLNYLQCNNEEELIEIKAHTCNNHFENLFQILNDLIFKPIIKISVNDDTLSTNNIDKERIEKEYLQLIKERFYSKNYSMYMKFSIDNHVLLPLLQCVNIFRIFERLQQHIFTIIENLNFYSLVRLFELYSEIYSQKQNYNFSSEHIIITEIQKELGNLQSHYITPLCAIFNNCFNKLRIILYNQFDFVSDKLNQLLIRIIEYYNNNVDNNKLIIFVNDYIVAHFLEEPIKIILSNINPNYNSLSIPSIKHTPLESISNITLNETTQFKIEQANVLITVPSCEENITNFIYGLVIVYNELESNQNYIQIKERIKTQNSKFLVFIESKKEIMQKNKELIWVNEYFKKLFGNNIVKDLRREDYMKTKRKKDYYYIPYTQAKLSLRNIAFVYNEIIQGLNNKNKKVELNKQFEKRTNEIKQMEFKCIAIYSFSELQEEKLNLESAWYNNKVSAENEIYLLFTKHLHINKMIDDHFKLIV